MKKIAILLMVTIAFGFTAISCKSKKDLQNTDAEKNEIALQKFRIVVDVFSTDDGINDKAIPLFEKFIYDYEGNMGIAVGYSELKYGVNGATRICIPLDDIKPELVDDFIERLKLTFDGQDKVKIEENVPCAPVYKK